MNLDKKEILIKLENVGINQDNKWLVHDVSLEIERGKILTLIGPNGSGKTTTAKIALGIHKNIKGKQLMINLNTRDPFSVLVFICAAAARSLSDMSDKDAGLTS